MVFTNPRFLLLPLRLAAKTHLRLVCFQYMPNPALNRTSQAVLARSAVHGTFSPTGPSRPTVARRLALRYRESH